MPKATIPSGDLINLADCYLFVPSCGEVKFHALPDLSDTKSAVYAGEPIIGRATTLDTYSHSDARNISLTIHLHARKKADCFENLQILRAIQSATYPREQESGFSFIPPPVCRLKCGKLLADEELCVYLKSYSTKFPRDVPWDEDTYTPWYFTIDTSWTVVYKNSDLPGQNRILNTGR